MNEELINNTTETEVQEENAVTETEVNDRYAEGYDDGYADGTPSLGKKLLFGALIGGAGYGLGKGVEWCVKKIKNRKYKKTEDSDDVIDAEVN